MSTVRILGLFNDFDAASNSIREVRHGNFPALNLDDVTIKSPIEHPEVEELLGERPAPIRKYTLLGALFGLTHGFLFLAASQGNFFAQQKGGKPIIPIPPDLVLTYELTIMGGVYLTVLGFLLCAGLPARMKSELYNTKISEDQIGVVVKADEHTIGGIKEIFRRHHAISIAEEVLG
jgi:Protein of unknown function (DUF3341)